MSVVLDEQTDTVVLDHLDFEVTCEALKRGVDRCGVEATHQAICVECGRVTCVVCVDHAIWARKSERRTKHTACGARGRICDLVEVVPL
ncbi:hypothetical protein ABY45_14675 [Microbacterium maritypicum]|uniref:hypothetical protein n=1 Tax=Microbacterium maritypicum TaxID=33918 RepID=UPI003D6DE510